MRTLKVDTIWRYVYLEVFSPTLLGLFVYVLVFVMNALFELAELAIKRDLSIRSVVTILFYYLPRVLEMTIPMAILLYTDEVHQGGDFLEKVFIYQNEEGGKELVTVARRAQIEYDRRSGVAQFILESGVTHTTTPNEPESYQLSRFEKQMIVKEPDESFKLRSSLLNRPLPKNYHEQSLADLAHSIIRAGAIEHADTRNRVIGNILAIMHERFALPVACLVFAILGVPLGIMNRRGGGASGFTPSIGISIRYWVLYSVGQEFLSQGQISPYVGLWVGHGFLGGLG